MKKYLVITGVSTGIGHGLSEHYLSKGYSVIGTVRKESDANDLELNENFYKVVYDVRDKSKLNFLQESVQKIIGDNPLFALINNAGIAKAGPLEHVSEEDFEEQMDVNVFAVRRITNTMLPLMKEGSRIVMISSVSGLFNSPFTGPYAISKHAIESMSDVYRRELAAFGIKVIAIEPGPIKSKIWGKSRGTLDKYKTTRYALIAGNADKMIDNAENSALDVSFVAAACDKALFNEKPKSRYLVHKKPILFKFVSHWLPDSIADYFVAKTLKGGKKHRMV